MKTIRTIVIIVCFILKMLQLIKCINLNKSIYVCVPDGGITLNVWRVK